LFIAVVIGVGSLNFQSGLLLTFVGGGAVAVGAVGGVEGLEIELVDRLDHEPGEVVVVEPVAEVRRQEHRLVAVAAEEVLGHGPILFAVADVKRALRRGFVATASARRGRSGHCLGGRLGVVPKHLRQ
jgi:hypothetical protein